MTIREWPWVRVSTAEIETELQRRTTTPVDTGPDRLSTKKKVWRWCSNWAVQTMQTNDWDLKTGHDREITDTGSDTCPKRRKRVRNLVDSSVCNDRQKTYLKTHASCPGHLSRIRSVLNEDLVSKFLPQEPRGLSGRPSGT